MRGQGGGGGGQGHGGTGGQGTLVLNGYQQPSRAGAVNAKN